MQNRWGVWNYEISLLQWNTAFDDTKEAWNNTFVHPDSAHWLKKGERLGFPGLTLRTGLTDNIDIGAYWIKNPGANYGFWGGQVQYNIVNDFKNKWAASARINVVSIYGPEDLGFTVFGLDFLASKDYSIYSDWLSISPYVGVSTHLSNARETTDAVNLHDEHVIGAQGMVGAVSHISFTRFAVEYNVGLLNTISFKMGVDF
jgi:hypothetical protein